jgi:hypothetical protein
VIEDETIGRVGVAVDSTGFGTQNFYRQDFVRL